MTGSLLVFYVFIVVVLLMGVYVKWWIRLALAIYQFVVFHLFTNQYNKIMQIDKVEVFSKSREALVDKYEVYFYLPFFIFVFYAYFKWIKNIKTGSQLALLICSIILFVVIFLVINLFMYMLLGYEP
ncbi:hypothetical protein [Bacillus sp. 1P06AnD]|uniref:hypothetical protein n=1 Tax=Bacillus sp. 1P06AnD TaxID=3132208 RepID=UPI0039A0DE7B